MSAKDVKSYIPVDFDPFGDAAAPPVHFPMTEAQREVWASVQMGAEASNAYNVCHAFRVRGAFSIGRNENRAAAVGGPAPGTAAGVRSGRRNTARTRFCHNSRDHRGSFVDDAPRNANVKRRTTWTRKPMFLSISKKARCAAQSSCAKTGKRISSSSPRITLCATAGRAASWFWIWASCMRPKALVCVPRCRRRTRFNRTWTRRTRQEKFKQALAAEEYWKAQFATPIEPLELPLDFLRKPVKSYAAERQRRQIPDDALS